MLDNPFICVYYVCMAERAGRIISSQAQDTLTKLRAEVALADAHYRDLRRLIRALPRAARPDLCHHAAMLHYATQHVRRVCDAVSTDIRGLQSLLDEYAPGEHPTETSR